MIEYAGERNVALPSHTVLSTAGNTPTHAIFAVTTPGTSMYAVCASARDTGVAV